MSRFLVTGASGFVGSALVGRLERDGHEVVAPGSKALDLLTVREADLSAAIAQSGATHCIHCAWYTNHSDYLTHEVNRAWVEASLSLERAFRQGGGQRFIALGTLQEYDASEGLCSEDRTPLRPETLYARCKLELLERLAASGGDFAWPRIFFTYGPGDRAARLVPTMVAHYSRGEPAGPKCGGLRRDYIHIDDVARQLAMIANGTVQGAINTGTGEAPSLSEIYAAGARAFGRPELALANDRTDGQAPLIVADLARFRSEVGDPAARGIEQGLADLIGAKP